MTYTSSGELVEVSVSAHSDVHLPISPLTGSSKKTVALERAKNGNSNHLDYGPQMLVRRDFGKKTINSDLKGYQARITLRRSEKDHSTLEGSQEYQDTLAIGNNSAYILERRIARGSEEDIKRFGIEVQNKVNMKEWVQVRAKWKSRGRGKPSGKENKFVVKANSYGKSKVDKEGPGIMVTNSFKALMSETSTHVGPIEEGPSTWPMESQPNTVKWAISISIPTLPVVGINQSIVSFTFFFFFQMNPES